MHAGRTPGIGPVFQPAWMARHRPLIVGAIHLLVGAALAVLLIETWHGPTILSLGGSHGVDAGDLPAIPLLALAAALALRRPTGLDVAAPALALGALLLLAGILTANAGGPLVPAGGGTFDRSIQRTFAHSPEFVNDWSHVALTYDGHRLRLYRNGHQLASGAAHGTITRSAQPLWIGGSHPYGEFFRGLIDEVRVYDRPLSAAQVRLEMAQPIAPSGSRAAGRPGAGLVAAYAFDARSSRRAVDSSPAGNTGAIRGPLWTSGGRFGGALRFTAGHELVRVPASASLNPGRGLTLSAWIRPSEHERGWRTILHRQTDVYFLMAGSPRQNGAGRLDDMLAVLIGAGFVLLVVFAADRGRWLRDRSSRWWPCVTLFLAGSVADAALAPRGALIGPLLVTVWLALTTSSRREARGVWLIAAVLGVMTVASLGEVALDLGRDDGGDARSLALVLCLVIAGYQAAPNARAKASVAPSR